MSFGKRLLGAWGGRGGGDENRVSRRVRSRSLDGLTSYFRAEKKIKGESHPGTPEAKKKMSASIVKRENGLP